MKKKILLSISFVSIAILTFGQNFGEVGTQWFYEEHGQGPPYSEYLHLVSTTDTIIDGKTTHKIEGTYYNTYTGDTIAQEPFYVYEQSDTVFKYDFQKAKFLTLYIFNASIGDTLTLDYPGEIAYKTDITYRLVIDTIENVVIDGITLKKYKTTGLDSIMFYDGGYFMDRIGGLDWIFPRALPITLEAGGPIRCYMDNEIDTNFSSVPCDYVSASTELKINNEVNVYPNPASDRIIVESEYRIEKIELSDITGKLILSTNKPVIDIERIKNGFYILTIYLEDGKIIEKKIIKNAL